MTEAVIDYVEHVGKAYAALIEDVAKEIAVANNGGEWATHYTEKQKQVWRIRAAGVIAQVTRWIESET